LWAHLHFECGEPVAPFLPPPPSRLFCLCYKFEHPDVSCLPLGPFPPISSGVGPISCVHLLREKSSMDVELRLPPSSLSPFALLSSSLLGFYNNKVCPCHPTHDTRDAALTRNPFISPTQAFPLLVRRPPHVIWHVLQGNPRNTLSFDFLPLSARVPSTSPGLECESIVL